MKPNKEDKIISDFFNAHKESIEDSGFSRRIINLLPKQTDNLWLRSVIMYTAIFAGSLLVSLNINILMRELTSFDLIPLSFFIICFCISILAIISAINNSTESGY